MFVFLATVTFFFFYCTSEAEQNEVSTGFSEWFVFDFHLEDYYFLIDHKKKRHTKQQFLWVFDNNVRKPWTHQPRSLSQENRLFKQKGVLCSLYWPVKLTNKECSLISGLRQHKSALLSAPAACRAPKSSLPAQQGESEGLDPARCWCSQINEAPSRVASQGCRAPGRGEAWDQHFDSNIKLWNHIFRFGGN